MRASISRFGNGRCCRRGARWSWCGSIRRIPANAAKLAAFRAAYGICRDGAVGRRLCRRAGRRSVETTAARPCGWRGPTRRSRAALFRICWSMKSTYDDVAPWPTTPDGTGPSLTRTSTLIYGNEPTNWSGQAASPGTVGDYAAVGHDHRHERQRHVPRRAFRLAVAHLPKHSAGRPANLLDRVGGAQWHADHQHARRG